MVLGERVCARLWFKLQALCFKQGDVLGKDVLSQLLLVLDSIHLLLQFLKLIIFAALLQTSNEGNNLAYKLVVGDSEMSDHFAVGELQGYLGRCHPGL